MTYGTCTGHYDKSARLERAFPWTLMRFTEYENPKGDTCVWLIRKDGCMHCEDPRCPQGLSLAGCDRSVLEPALSISTRRIASAALLHSRVSLRHPAHLEERQERPTNVRSAPTAWPWPRARLRQGLPHGAIVLRHTGGHEAHARSAFEDSEIARGSTKQVYIVDPSARRRKPM